MYIEENVGRKLLLRTKAVSDEEKRKENDTVIEVLLPGPNDPEM